MSWNRYSRSISVDIDIDDVLNNIDDEDLKDYVLNNDVVTAADFSDNITDNLESAANNIEHKDLYTFLQYCRNVGCTHITRSKSEMKEWINEIIDTYGVF